ncbi:MAG TPA: hypothetical protein VGL73_15640, partial [Caulobacteraceae bacterium]
LEAASIAHELVTDPDMASSPYGSRELPIMRAGLPKSLIAMLGILALPGSSDDWRRARMPYLLAVTTQAAKLNTPAELAPVRARVMALAEASDDATLRADLAEMAKTLGVGAS